MERSMGAQRAPEADESLEQPAVRRPLELVVTSDDDDLGGGEGTTRRAMVTRGLLLVAGAFGAGVAATRLSDGGEPKPVAAPGSVKLSLTSPDVRWFNGAAEPGKLPAAGAVKAPHGTLYDSKGHEVGDFSTAVMSGAGTPMGMLRLEFTDGTIVGVGSGMLDGSDYAVIGGTGRFDGTTGSFVARTSGKNAEFSLRLTTIAR
jgi:hypothetical protein